MIIIACVFGFCGGVLLARWSARLNLKYKKTTTGWCPACDRPLTSIHDSPDNAQPARKERDDKGCNNCLHDGEDDSSNACSLCIQTAATEDNQVMNWHPKR